jgi:hypothetical protein
MPSKPATLGEHSALAWWPANHNHPSEVVMAQQEANPAERVEPEWVASGRVSHSEKQLYLILFPQEFEAEVVEALDASGVPGFTEFPKLTGRGQRGRHFDNPTWPGAAGAVFTVIGPDQEQALIPALQDLNQDLESRSNGLHGLHLFSLPCRQII